jgi:hypothetical protein
VFTEQFGGRMPRYPAPELLELEWKTGRTEPYRSVGRLVYLVGRKSPSSIYT